MIRYVIFELISGHLQVPCHVRGWPLFSDYETAEDAFRAIDLEEDAAGAYIVVATYLKQ